MTKTAWIIFAATTILLLGGLVYLSGQNKLDVEDVNANTIQEAQPQSGNIGEHVYGNKDSKVILVEYGDFQCAGCGAAFPTVRQVKEKYKDDIAFVYRNFPITSIHPNALVAAATAEAAGKQGKFWEMHDTLFESQDEWKDATIENRAGIFESYAKELNLDIDTFKDEVAASTTTQKINFDTALGKKQGVNSTPTFFLNGRELTQDEWGELEAFEKTVEAEIKKQQ